LTTHISTDKNSIREEREGKEALALSLHSLEPSEGSEKKILVDMLGSLKDPCNAAVPMGTSGLVESA
jgi:hypothetical protein